MISSDLEAKIKAQEERLESRQDPERPPVVKKESKLNQTMDEIDARILSAAAQGIINLISFLQEGLKVVPLDRRADYQSQINHYEAVAVELMGMRERALGKEEEVEPSKAGVVVGGGE